MQLDANPAKFGTVGDHIQLYIPTFDAAFSNAQLLYKTLFRKFIDLEIYANHSSLKNQPCKMIKLLNNNYYT